MRSSLRSAKSNSGAVQKVNWIKCDCCNKWCHSVCCGLLRKEHTKLAKDTQFFKCVICCLRAVPEVGRKQCLELLENTKLIHSDLHTSSCSNIDSPSTAVVSSPFTEVFGSESSTISASQNTIHNTSDNILIIDNINNPAEFSSSKRILDEINQFCPEVQVEFAYSLAKGGVAIHTVDKSGRDILLNKLPSESFGGGVKHFPKDKSCETVFIKGVCTSVLTHEFTRKIQGYGVETIEVRRLVNRHSGKPLQVIKVKCSVKHISRLLSCQIVIKNRRCITEKQHSVRVVRCYNCQSFGHLARFCPNQRRCEFCAGSHIHDHCTNEVCCANCNNKHPASSPHCSVYISRHEKYTNNIQSVNTSLSLLRNTMNRLHIDVALLQEIWHPVNNTININNYSSPIIKVRQGSEGGGVAIITHQNVKCVHLKEYDMAGLEAVWADIKLDDLRMVVGSVYVPPGDFSALALLDTVICSL